MELCHRILDGKGMPEDCLIKNLMIQNMQFGRMPCKARIDAVFILRRIQEEYLAKQQKLYMCFADLEKAIDSSEKSCGMGNETERYSRSIGYSSDEPAQRCKEKSESWNTFF